MSHRILLVEDEEGLRITLQDRLSGEGYEVEIAEDGRVGFDRAVAGGFDLILLDVMLPAKSGVDVCRDLRRQGNQTPVLMLTAKSQTIDKVLGLKIGADDYLTKPFEMLELLARIEALLRRSQGSPKALPEGYEFGSVRVDLRGTRVFHEDEELSLSAKEFQLLRYLIEHRGETLARDKLLQDVLGLPLRAFHPHCRCTRRLVAPKDRNRLQETPMDRNCPRARLSIYGMTTGAGREWLTGPNC